MQPTKKKDVKSQKNHHLLNTVKWMKEAENDVQFFRIPCVCKRQFNQMTIPGWKKESDEQVKDISSLYLNLAESINNCRKKHEKSIPNNNKLSRQQEKDTRESSLPSFLQRLASWVRVCVRIGRFLEGN